MAKYNSNAYDFFKLIPLIADPAACRDDTSIRY